MKNPSNLQKGFSLIEIMVSLAVFSIVVLVATGALLSIIDANKKTQALKAVVNNLNFALENMSRNIRVGTKYHCGETGLSQLPNFSPQDCVGGAFIAFHDQEKNRITAYRLSGGAIQKSDDIFDPDEGFADVTAPEINITSLRFDVSGSQKTDNLQPRVILVVRGEMKNTKLKVSTDFNIQTTLTQRVLDFNI